VLVAHLTADDEDPDDSDASEAWEAPLRPVLRDVHVVAIGRLAKPIPLIHRASVDERDKSSEPRRRRGVAARRVWRVRPLIPL
jgi:hypothetical protein